MLYGENNQPDQAAQVLRPMLDGTANDLEIYLDLAEVYLQDQRFSDAEQARDRRKSSRRDPRTRRRSDSCWAAYTSGKRNTIRPNRSLRACWRSIRAMRRC